jgi:hypothetical protein
VKTAFRIGAASMKQDDDQRASEETEQRLQKILQGAFSGPPTPLKDIPKRNGNHREVRKSTKKTRTDSATRQWRRHNR